MIEIKESKELLRLKDNKFEGTLPKLTNSKIVFYGKNNILYCDKNVNLVNSTLEFKGDNSVIYLKESNQEYKLSFTMNNNTNAYIGKNNYFNGNLYCVLSEETNLFIGNNCLFSFGIWIRTADPHLIYDSNTFKRLNYSKSVYIGDHIWVGQNAMILKGTNIDSGSIIGAQSVVSNKTINNNTIWAGNPAKKVKENIFWDGKCVHLWTKEDTKKSSNYNDLIKNTKNKKTQYIYNYSSNSCINYSYIETIFNENPNEIIKKLSLLKEDKNRFVHNVKSKKNIKKIIKKLLKR